MDGFPQLSATLGYVANDVSSGCMSSNSEGPVVVGQSRKSAVQVAREAAQSGALAVQSAKRKTTTHKPVIGQSASNKLVKSVNTVRKVDIFVSRLDPHTVANELVDCVESVKSDIEIVGTTCTKLKSKYEHLYSSFYVEISVNSNNLKQAVDTFMCPDSWPQGVFVKRYFRKRDGTP